MFPVKHVFADTFQLSGKVTDGSNNPIANTTVTVTDPNSQATIGTATTNTNGDYSLSVPQGTYNVTATPPSSSGFQSVTVTNQNISSDTVLNFTLVPIPTFFTLSGHLTDRAENGIGGVNIALGHFQEGDFEGVATAQTDGSGFYSIHVTTPGSYGLRIIGDPQNSSSFVPEQIRMNTTSESVNITQDTTLDLQIPSSLVTVHVQGPSQNPVENAFVGVSSQPSLTLSSLQFTVTAGFQSGHTDASGNVTIPALPGTATISVTSPTNSLLGASVSQVITQDTTIPITLATAPIVPILSGHLTDRAGNGIGGVNIGLTHDQGETLVATAQTDGSGFYSIHVTTPGSYGLRIIGDPQDASSVLPRSIRLLTTGDSVNITQDTTLDLQIPSSLVIVHVQDSSQNPVENAFVDVHSSGQITIGSLQFNILQGEQGGHTDASGNVTIPALPGTATISITPPTGNNLIGASATVNITGNTTQVFSLQSNNKPPTVGAITVSPGLVQVNHAITASASFTDPNTSDTHTASWNWGDGNTTTGAVTESNGTGSVSNNHTYSSAGAFTITLSVTDNHGSTGTKQLVVAVSPSSSFAGVNLTGLNYSGANFTSQNLSGSNLQKATFNNTNFQSANLSGVNAPNASFQNANFTGANLTGSTFQGANFTNANMTGANLKGANFNSAIMTGVTWSNTICPDGTNSNNHNNTCTGHGGGL